MLKFKEYINENTAYYSPKPIEVDTRRLMNIVDAFNAELDALTAKPYQNAPIFLNQLRGCLEKNGMLLPAEATPHFLHLSAELIYKMGETGLHLYIVYDTTDDGYVDGYAQIVNQSDLKDLLGMDPSNYMGHDTIQQRPSTWYAKRDDDSGDDSDY
jgi:hypothetical protein